MIWLGTADTDEQSRRGLWYEQTFTLKQRNGNDLDGES
jgi:hypothetical protein